MNKYFEILDDFKLSNSETLHETIRRFDQPALENLRQEIEKYYQENLSLMIKEVQEGEGFNIYLSRVPSSPNLQFLRAACLYSDKLIMWDPLYGLLSYLQKGPPPEGVKQQLTYLLPQLLLMRELAEYGILVLIPNTMYSQKDIQGIEQVSRIDSESEGFRRICFGNMEIGIDRGETEDGYPYSMHIVGLGFDSPRAFSVTHSATIPPKTEYRFTMGPGRPFTLETPKEAIELKPKRVPLRVMETDEQLKDTVNHAIYQSAYELNFDLLFSEVLNATYFTDFDVRWKLLNWKLKGSEERLKSEGEVSTLLPSIIGMDLKFLDEIPLRAILKVREKEGYVFEEFRVALKESCRLMDSIPYTTEFKKEVRNLSRERIDPELRKLDREFNRIIKHRLTRGGVVALGSIIATVLTGNPIPLIGLAGSLKEYAEYEKEADRLKENSMYFLWRVKKTK